MPRHYRSKRGAPWLFHEREKYTSEKTCERLLLLLLLLLLHKMRSRPRSHAPLERGFVFLREKRVLHRCRYDACIQADCQFLSWRDVFARFLSIAEGQVRRTCLGYMIGSSQVTLYAKGLCPSFPGARPELLRLPCSF